MDSTAPEYDEEMPYIAEHLSSLRREITLLQTVSARQETEAERSEALGVRTKRLLEIKKELFGMLSRGQDQAIWWDKMRRTNRAA